MNNNRYTMNDFTKKFGVTRQAIIKVIKKYNIQSIGKNGQSKIYDEKSFNIIKSHFDNKTPLKHKSQRKTPTTKKSTTPSKTKTTGRKGRKYKYGVKSVNISVPSDIAPILQKYLDEANPEQRKSFFENNVKNEIKRIFTNKLNKM